MSPRVLAAFSANAGLLTRDQALDLGISPDDIKHLVRRGDWVIVRRGVYTTREFWETLDEYVGRPRLRARAAIRKMRRAWVLSHDSAALEHGMAILCLEPPLVHVTRPGWTSAWTENGVGHHLARFQQHQVMMVNGLPVLDPARTAIDIAREHGLDAGVVACDAALRMGVEPRDLVAAYEPMVSWPGVRTARESVRLADPGAENPNESLGRMLVEEAGIGTPDTQFPLVTARGLVWCDIRVGNHIIEIDGRVKYRDAAEGGVATKPADQVVWEERKRERLIKDERLGVSRLVWADYWGPRRAEAIARLRADAADTEARYGATLHEHLARQAAAIREGYGGRRPAS